MLAHRMNRPTGVWGLATLAGLWALAATPLQAQSALSFDLGLRLESDSNVDLTAPVKQARHGGQLTFGAEWQSQTEVSKLAIAAKGALGAFGGKGASTGRGLTSPSARLSYERAVSSADMNIEASIRESNLNELDPASLDLASGGKQRVGRVGAGLNWRKDAPLGFGLRASSEKTTFQDAPGRIERRRDVVGGHIRADLSEVLKAKFDLSRANYRPKVGEARGTTTGRLTFELQQPTALWRLTTGFDETPEGSRERLSIGRVIERPLGKITWNLGAVKGVNGKTNGVADISWEHDLPEGGLMLTASRDVSSNDETDRETVENRLGVNFRKQMTQTGGVHLGASWSETSYSAPNYKITGLTLSAVWSQSLTEDWSLDMGYAHRNRKSDYSPRTSSDKLHLELRRSFVTKF